jgi:hypothetical protein
MALSICRSDAYKARNTQHRILAHAYFNITAASSEGFDASRSRSHVENIGAMKPRDFKVGALSLDDVAYSAYSAVQNSSMSTFHLPQEKSLFITYYTNRKREDGITLYMP